MRRNVAGTVFAIIGFAASFSAAAPLPLANGRGAIALGSATGSARPGISEGLAVWLRASEGVTTDGTGAVARWQNMGSLGSELDACSYSGTVAVASDGPVRATGVSEPVLRFSGAAYLKSAAQSAFGINDAGGTWFIVFNPTGARNDVCLFGTDQNNRRFGVFFTAQIGNNPMRGFLFSSGYRQLNVMSNAFQLADYRSAPAENGETSATFYRDATAFVSGQGSSYNITETPGRLTIGHFNADSWNKPFIGDIAEVRIYSRALNGAERIIVQQQLAARYGLDAGKKWYIGGEPEKGDYDLDVAGIGCRTDDDAPGSATASEDAGGLRLCALDDSFDEDGEFALAGHSGAAHAWTSADVDGVSCISRWQRDWFITASQKQSGYDVRLAFNPASAGLGAPPDGSSWLLIYRESESESDFSVLPVAAQELDGEICFDLRNRTLATGYYTLGAGPAPSVAAAPEPPCAGIPGEPAGWWRADSVKLAGGAMAGWPNLGTFGSLLDASVALGAPVVQPAAARAESASEPVVRFDGDTLLKTSTKTAFGVSDELTYFIVMNPALIGSARRESSVFGTANAASSRFGMFFTSTASANYPLRLMGFSDAPSTTFLEYSGITNGALQIVDFRRTSSAISATADGETVGARNATLPAPAADTFIIGHMMGDSWGKKFTGDIAELRIYNRALNDAERIILQNHLAARYGISLAENAIYSGADADAGDYDLDVVGIGCSTNSAIGCAPGSVAESASSAGLALASACPSAIAGGAFAFAGHKLAEKAWIKNGNAFTMARSWAISASNAESLMLLMRFSFAEAGVAKLPLRNSPSYRLLYRPNEAAEWSDAGLEAQAADGIAEFALSPGELRNGLYTLGATTVSPGTVITIR